MADVRMDVQDTLALKDYILKNSVADLTAEQLQHILNIVETTCKGQGPSGGHEARGEGSSKAHWDLGGVFLLHTVIHGLTRMQHLDCVIIIVIITVY